MELTNEQLRRQDFVDNTIFEMLQKLNPSEKNLDWDIESIAEIRDCIEDLLVKRLQLTDRMIFYPYIKD